MKKIISSAFVLFAACQMASAISVTSSVGGAPTGVNYLNFDDLAPQVGTSGSWVSGGPSGTALVTITPDGRVASGAASGLYAAPYVSGLNGAVFGNSAGADSTPYLTTGNTQATGGSVTLKFAGLQQYLGILWGSVDNYNTLSFYNGASLVNAVTGLDVYAGATGDQGVNGTYYVNINTDSPFDRVVATSSQYAFEFDNVAYNSSPVPDGGLTVALLGLAMSSVVWVRRKVIG